MGISKSIAKWTISKFSKCDFEEFVRVTHTADLQSKRGKVSKGGGRPKNEKSLDTLRPWVELGISRRTFFYRKKSSYK